MPISGSPSPAPLRNPRLRSMWMGGLWLHCGVMPLSRSFSGFSRSTSRPDTEPECRRSGIDLVGHTAGHCFRVAWQRLCREHALAMTSRWRAAALLLAGSAVGVTPLGAQESGVTVGTAAPAVVVKDLDGRPVDLGRYLGKKPLFLEFWATWCEQCEELLPELRAAQSRFGNKVEFFGINVTVNQTPELVRQ